LPFQTSHLASDNKGVERAIPPNPFLLPFLRDRVMTRFEQNFKMSLVVGFSLVATKVEFASGFEACSSTRIGPP
jgi:hypothetical protein